MASSIEVDQESSVLVKEEVNSSAYLSRHSGQVYSDGRSFSGFERNKTWISTAGGGYKDLSNVSGADSPNDSRAVLMVDFDDDGDLDLFVHSIQRERHALYRNDAVAQPNFLKLRLRGTTANAEAIGATVIVHGPQGPVAQGLMRGGGFASCQPPELVFGLGAAKSAHVEVLWPGGAREDFGLLPVGTRAVLTEGTAKFEPFTGRGTALPDPLPPGLRLSEGELIPKIYVNDAAGNPVTLDLAELADGVPLFVNLWASYCGPCVGELSFLAEMHQRGEQHVLGLSVDALGDIPRAEELAKLTGVNFPHFYLPTGDAPAGAISLSELVDLERLTLPTTLVITPEGRVDSILRGPLN